MKKSNRYHLVIMVLGLVSVLVTSSATAITITHQTIAPITPVPVQSVAQAPIAKTKMEVLAQHANNAIQQTIHRWQRLSTAMLIQQRIATPPKNINIAKLLYPSQ